MARAIVKCTDCGENFYQDEGQTLTWTGGKMYICLKCLKNGLKPKTKKEDVSDGKSDDEI